MKTSGLITLTTDFGHKGPFTGVMKGVIHGRYPGATVVDLTHDIPAHWPPEAGFWIERAYRWFPPGSVHVGIVDPGVGTDRRILVVVHDGHVFLGPDNGLLGPLLAIADPASIRGLDTAMLSGLDLPPPSMTFHGRDIFAPVAAEIAGGRLAPDAVGDVVADWVPAWLDEPEASAGRITGVIITIDTFGNLISNIGGDLVAALEQPVVQLAGHRFELRPTYGRAQPGDYLALINSFDVLEIARAEGSAADGLGVERGAPVLVTAAVPD